MKSAGENIRNARKKAGISARGLSELIGDGYTKEMIYNWERGKCHPSRYAIEQISKILEIPTQELVNPGEYLSGEWDSIDIRTIINRILQKKHLTLLELSEALGVNRLTIYEWKNGRYKPSMFCTRKILDLMGMDSVPELVELLEEKEE